MAEVTLASVTRSEWIKFRSVRSTAMGAIVFVVLTIGLGLLVTTLIRSHWATLPTEQKLVFDAVATSLAGTSLAQYAAGVIGSLFITAEYGSGAIRTTLAAVPQRLRLVAAKGVVLVASMLVLGEAVCFGAFFIGQRVYSGLIPASTDSLANSAVLRSVVLGGVYLTLLAVLGLALGLLLRSSPATISTFTGLVLVLPLIIFFLPSSLQDTLTKYEPSALGRAMMSSFPPDKFFGAWTALGVLVIYVAAALIAALVVFERRDA
jgi:ABC-2 type transport system permease protein